MFRLSALLLTAAALAPAAALACSPAPGYSIPTNLQLAADANAIIVGQVTGGDGSGIDVRPVTALKGLLPAESIRLEDMAIGPVEPATALDFAEPHPEAFTGGCIRRTFAPGAQVLFFLRRDDAAWRPAGGPFSRWAEDVSGADDPWVQLAILYAHAAQLEDAERAALLGDQVEALQARGAAAGGDRAALAMAGDIERSLAGPDKPLREPLPPVPDDAPEGTGIEDVQAGIDAMDGTS